MDELIKDGDISLPNEGINLNLNNNAYSRIGEEIARKRFTFVNDSATSLDNATLKTKNEESQLRFDTIELVRGNNKKHMPYKNSFKRKILDEKINSSEVVNELPYFIARSINRITIVNSRGCGVPPFVEGDLGTFKIYYTAINSGEIEGEPIMTYSYFLDSAGTIRLEDSFYASSEVTVLISGVCNAYNYEINLGEFVKVPIF